MAPGMSKGVIWGTAVGAAVILLVMGSIMIILCGRNRGRARIDQAYAAGERRPNKYSRGHFSITDADVARMPGSRTGNRSSSQRKYGPTRGYTPMAARENPLSRPILRALPVEMANRQSSVATTPSWPALPRQLTKSSTAPAGKLKNTPSNSITEKSLMLRLDDSPREIEQELTRNGQRDNTSGYVHGEIVQRPMPIIPRNPHLDSFSNTMLTSKSFSYEKPHNIRARSTAQPRELHVNKEAVFAPQNGISRPLFPRSSSLCGQNSGLAPNKPVPPLPLNISPPKRFRSTRSIVEAKSERTPGTIFFGEDSAPSVGYTLRPISLMDTGLRTKATPYTDAATRPEVPRRSASEGGYWTPPCLLETEPPSLSNQNRVHVQPLLPKSQSCGGNTSILCRSRSSRLSISLLDHRPSRNPSVSSLATSLATSWAGVHCFHPNDSNFGFSRAVERDARLQVISSISPLTGFANNDTNSLGSKRASASIIQPTTIPLQDQLEKRPSSWATSELGQWDESLSILPTTPPVTNERGIGSNSRNLLRDSDTSLGPTAPTRIPLALQRINAAPPTSTGNFLRKPPERLSIHNAPTDFQKKMTATLVNKGPHYPQSTTRIESETGSCPTEPRILLERNLILQSASGTKLNCQKLPTPTATNFINPFSQKSSPSNTPLDNTTAKPVPEKQDLLQIGRVIQLPAPPSDPQDSLLLPKPLRLIRPRSPPSNRQPLHRTSNPTPRPAPTSRIEKSLVHNNSDLRKRIMKIRMMNSDAGDLRTKQHRLYLGLGRNGDKSPDGE